MFLISVWGTLVVFLNLQSAAVLEFRCFFSFAPTLMKKIYVNPFQYNTRIVQSGNEEKAGKEMGEPVN